MSALLDIDDVVAGNPSAQRELAELRAKVESMTAELARVKAAVMGAPAVLWRITDGRNYPWTCTSKFLADKYAATHKMELIARPNLEQKQ